MVVVEGRQWLWLRKTTVVVEGRQCLWLREDTGCG